MTYDLRRLRLRGLIERSLGTHRYHVTPYGLRVAFFFTKLYLRIFRPHAPSLEPFSDDIPRRIRTALLDLEAAIDRAYQRSKNCWRSRGASRAQIVCSRSGSAHEKAIVEAGEGDLRLTQLLAHPFVAVQRDRVRHRCRS